LLSTSKHKLEDTSLDTFEYDVPGYGRELKEKISWMAYSIEQFTDYTKIIEKGVAKPLPLGQVEAFKKLSNRHGYSFLM
jgi:hypothetical protein